MAKNNTKQNESFMEKRKRVIKVVCLIAVFALLGTTAVTMGLSSALVTQ